MSKPKLSVILPNYNHADYLDRCLSAILDQSFRDLELIVIDDCSTDASMEVIQSFASHDPRVKVFRNPQNQGVIATLNRALSYTQADYVFGAASDDYILPGYFEAAFKLLDANPGAGIALGVCATVADDGRLVNETPGYWSSEPAFLPPAELARRITHCAVPGPVVWRKDAFLAAGGYVPELRWHGDWFTLQAVAFRHGVCFIPARTSIVRYTDTAYSAGQGRAAAQRQVLWKLLARFAAPEFRDILPYIRDSWTLVQFGPDLVRAAVTMPDLPDIMLPVLAKYVFAHGPHLLGDYDDDVRAGTARTLARYGRQSVGLVRALKDASQDRSPRVAAAAADARKAIWKDVPVGSRVFRTARAMVGSALRGFDWAVRPLHHQRLAGIETHLRELVRLGTAVQNGTQHISDQINMLEPFVKGAVPRTAHGKKKAA